MSLHINNEVLLLHTVIAKLHNREHITTELLDPEKVKRKHSLQQYQTNPILAPSNTRTRTPKTNTVQPVSWDSQPKASHQEVSSGSWASIASSKQQQDDSAFNNNDEGWNNSNNNNNDSTATADDWAPIPTTTTTTSNDDNANDDQPKTWASLLKYVYIIIITRVEINFFPFNYSLKTKN